MLPVTQVKKHIKIRKTENKSQLLIYSCFNIFIGCIHELVGGSGV